METSARELGTRIAATAGLVIAVLIVGALLRSVVRRALGVRHERGRFWATQSLHIATLAVAVGVIVAMWGSDLRDLSAFIGWLAAGLAVASQRMVTAFAG